MAAAVQKKQPVVTTVLRLAVIRDPDCLEKLCLPEVDEHPLNYQCEVTPLAATPIPN